MIPFWNVSFCTTICRKQFHWRNTSRFNICRQSVEETKQICNLLMEQVYYPEIKKKDKDFLELCYYFVKGTSAALPLFQFKSILCLLYNLVQHNPDISKPVYFELNYFQKWHYGLLTSCGNILKSYLWRTICNKLIYWSALCLKAFPFVAYYYYGFKQATVDIGI